MRCFQLTTINRPCRVALTSSVVPRSRMWFVRVRVKELSVSGLPSRMRSISSDSSFLTAISSLATLCGSDGS